MKLATEVGILVGLLRAAVVVLAFGSIALFNRMSPAIEEILSNNVNSLVAVEEMLAILAQPALEPGDAETRFEAALARARRNITETEEPRLLADIRARWPEASAIAASPAERAILVDQLLTLSAVNRASMEAMDREAYRLGAAGAWAVVLLSLGILFISQLLSGRLDARVVRPLVAIDEAVEAAEQGDTARRCPERGPVEIRAIAAGLNRLLDVSAAFRNAGRDAPTREHALVEHLLDARPGAWAAVDARGALLAANAEARVRLEGARRLDGRFVAHREEVLPAKGLRLVRLDVPNEKEG